MILPAPEGHALGELTNTFKTRKYRVTIADAPGYRDFIKSGIIEPSPVDCAVLIVSARIDEFEQSMSKDGRAREYALLMFTMRIGQLIVVVNKMDDEDVSHSADRFYTIKSEVSSFLTKLGYHPKCVTPVVSKSCSFTENHALFTMKRCFH